MPTSDRFVRNPGQLKDLARRIAAKSLSPVDLVQGCLNRISEVDGQVLAWAHVDGERALAEARECEKEAQAGVLRGPLHGIPVGLKDNIDAEGLPTRCNSQSRANAPNAGADAEIVAAMRSAGAIVLGKVQTTEFAFFDPPATRNPHNLGHTPGGSSSGSGAAVASGTVPLALGTQTFASVNRPAAYCGISAFKPSTRSLSTVGVTPLAPYSDTVGFFGWTVEDSTTLYEAVSPFYMRGKASGTPDKPRVVMIDDPLIGDASPEALKTCHTMHESFRPECTVETRQSPVPMERLSGLLHEIQLFELSRIHRGLLDLPANLVGPRLRGAIIEGSAISDQRYHRDRAELDGLRELFFSALEDVSAFLWPAAPGPAPEGIGSTGDPRYIAPWTALGGPIVTIPATMSATGLPLGCILAGRPGTDIYVCGLARRLAGVWAQAARN
jgi:aspartyl-tRNA(Asn)/glutamyl-tRNA(Gln) amidotransferase subunit A